MSTPLTRVCDGFAVGSLIYYRNVEWTYPYAVTTPRAYRVSGSTSAREGIANTTTPRRDLTGSTTSRRTITGG